jgi:hypothetical protein
MVDEPAAGDQLPENPRCLVVDHVQRRSRLALAAQCVDGSNLRRTRRSREQIRSDFNIVIGKAGPPRDADSQSPLKD